MRKRIFETDFVQQACCAGHFSLGEQDIVRQVLPAICDLVKHRFPLAILKLGRSLDFVSDWEASSPQFHFRIPDIVENILIESL